MRLPDDVLRYALTGIAALALGGCASIGGFGEEQSQPAAVPVAAGEAMADYPIVLGEPYTIGDRTYVPADALNYDEVGHGTIDGAGQGVTIAHRTLPLPSYVEVTSLETGRTILARVERRGPMTNDRFVGLSPEAASLLSADGTVPLRVRRVLPPEPDRARLRTGRRASERLDTPATLVAVLRERLPASGSADLRRNGDDVAGQRDTFASAFAALPPSTVHEAMTVATAGRAPRQIPLSSTPKADAGYPLPPLGPRTSLVRSAGIAADSAPAPTAQREGRFVVQAAAFSNRSNASRTAERIGGFISRSGSIFRVRAGPFAERSEAEAALAKVRAAGYSDAKVFTAS